MRRLAAMIKKLEAAERRSQPEMIYVWEGDPIPEGNFRVVTIRWGIVDPAPRDRDKQDVSNRCAVTID